jgi:hypothetical protein
VSYSRDGKSIDDPEDQVDPHFVLRKVGSGDYLRIDHAGGAG